jgi:hypothetical protein
LHEVTDVHPVSEPFILYRPALTRLTSNRITSRRGWPTFAAKHQARKLLTAHTEIKHNINNDNVADEKHLNNMLRHPRMGVDQIRNEEDAEIWHWRARAEARMATNGEQISTQQLQKRKRRE